MEHEMKNSLQDNLEALGALQQLIAKLYRFPLTLEQSDYFKQLSLDDDTAEGSEDIRQGLALMKDFCSETSPDTLLRVASDDFHRLFIGPHHLLAAPWSSVYMDKGSLFGPTEQRVEIELKRFGLTNPEGHREPCDHIAYELQFIADLHTRAGEAQSANNREAYLTYLGEAKDFYETYLTPWIDAFCTCVEEHAQSEFYRGLACLTWGVKAWELDFLQRAVDAEACVSDVFDKPTRAVC